MSTNELWNIDTLELPSTITATNEPSLSAATTLSAEVKALEASRTSITTELFGYETNHKALEIESKETQALLDINDAKLQSLLEATLCEKEKIAKIAEKIDALIGHAAPLHEAIKELETQLDEKVTEANKAKQLEDTKALGSKIKRECHRGHGKGYITAMRTFYNYSNWKSAKSTKDNRNIGPQTEAILLVFFDMPCWFSRSELEVFLGYKSPNHNVEGALSKMVESKMLLLANNKVGTEVYYLGYFGRDLTDRWKLPDVDYRPDQHRASIVIRADNGIRVVNKRQATARTSLNNKQQELSTTKKSSVTPSTKKKARTGPPVFPSDEDDPKLLTKRSSKTVNGKSTSSYESDSTYTPTPSDDESKKSVHDAVPSISINDIMDPDYIDEDVRSV
jgi:hypothetical protein